MKIPIKKHTKVRRPMSKWTVYVNWWENRTIPPTMPPIRVTDISKGLKNPLDIRLKSKVYDTWVEVKSLPESMAEGMTEQFMQKPSLLTRVKERFKR